MAWAAPCLVLPTGPPRGWQRPRGPPRLTFPSPPRVGECLLLSPEQALSHFPVALPVPFLCCPFPHLLGLCAPRGEARSDAAAFCPHPHGVRELGVPVCLAQLQRPFLPRRWHVAPATCPISRRPSGTVCFAPWPRLRCWPWSPPALSALLGDPGPQPSV